MNAKCSFDLLTHSLSQQVSLSHTHTRSHRWRHVAITPVCLVKMSIHAYGVPYETWRANSLINPVDWRGLVQSSVSTRTNNSLRLVGAMMQCCSVSMCICFSLTSFRLQEIAVTQKGRPDCSCLSVSSVSLPFSVHLPVFLCCCLSLSHYTTKNINIKNSHCC